MQTAHDNGKTQPILCLQALEKTNSDKRARKRPTGIYVTQSVHNFLSDKENAKKAVRDTLAYYDKRTGGPIKSLKHACESAKDIEKGTRVIEAKSRITAESIENENTDTKN